MAATDASTLASKRVVYVGGLPDQATVAMVRAAFIPFGPIRSVDIPMDYVAGTHKGFCFVEFDEADDATEAIFNMDGADLLGKTIKASLAQPNQIGKISSSGGGGNEAIWKSDEWFQQQVAGKDDEAIQEQKKLEQDTQALKDV